MVYYRDSREGLVDRLQILAMNISFVSNGIKVPIPQHIIDDSITIKDMIEDSDQVEDLEITTSLPVGSLNDEDSQDSLLVLDFLNCHNLLVATGTKIINSDQQLTEVTKQLFYVIPTLSYTALFSNKLTIDEVPNYDNSFIISYEEVVEWHKNDVDKLITLLNLRVPIPSLLPEITVSMLHSVESKMNSRHPTSCKCCVSSSNTDDIIDILVAIVDRLDELNDNVLEPLVRHFRYSRILDRMIRLRLLDGIRSLAADDLIPSINYVWLAVELKDDELVDLVMELRLTGSDHRTYCITENYNITLINGALQYNYLYPLKYININSVDKIPIKDIDITIDEEGLAQLIELVSDNSQLLESIIELLIINDRVELALPHLSRLSQLEECRQRWKSKVLLSNLADEDQYRQLMGCNLELNSTTYANLLTCNYTGLAKIIADSLSTEKMVVLLLFYLLNGEHDITNVGMIKRVTELISVESFRQCLTQKIAQFQCDVDRCNTREDYHAIMASELGIVDGSDLSNTPIEVLLQVKLILTMLTVRDVNRRSNEENDNADRIVPYDEMDLTYGDNNEGEDVIKNYNKRYNSIPDKIMISKESTRGYDPITEYLQRSNRVDNVGEVVSEYVSVIRELLGIRGVSH